MNKETEQLPEPDAPPVIRRRWRVSPIWLVPAVAALIGLSMLLNAWLSIGPEISVTFRTATGLEAGKTPVKFKDVNVGMVSKIALDEDGSGIVATLSLDKSAENLTRADTRFWVVRPRIGAGGVSGVDTLLSGAYIGVDRGTSSITSRNFTGLETPPPVPGDTPGSSFALHTDDLGSLDIGSPVYYRRVPVGRVSSYQLDEDGRSVRLQIFIDAPHDRFVTANTRFWNASGVDVSLGADGFRLKTQSVATIVSGGIAFATPEYNPGDLPPEGARYVLARDEASAMAPPDGPAQYLRLRFDQPLRGLSVGAPVLFSGVDIGKVVSVTLDYDEAARRFPTVVGIQAYPQRLGRVLRKLRKPDLDPQRQIASFLADMVAHGLRAQVRTGNLLTGQLYVSVEYVPGAPKAAFDQSARPLTLPTVGDSFEHLQEQIASIVGKLDKLPIEAIGKDLGSIAGKIDQLPFASIGKHLDTALADLDATLLALNTTLGQIDGQLLPEAAKTLHSARQTLDTAEGMLAGDAPLPHNLVQTLQEVQRAARSLRVLTDLLGRHPESLLRGRPDDEHAVPPESQPHSPAPNTNQEPLP
ncbi:MAG: MlaD family protein [Candidatus Accumulibacter sp.]|jgi:paraquat-inducible protein B|nr:MlaD family protein [Accumulibacter sp.]